MIIAERVEVQIKNRLERGLKIRGNISDINFSVWKGTEKYFCADRGVCVSVCIYNNPCISNNNFWFPGLILVTSNKYF